MRTPSLLVLLGFSSLALAAPAPAPQEETWPVYYTRVIVESATRFRNSTHATRHNETIEFDQSIPYRNTNGNLDHVVGLYSVPGYESLCIPYGYDGKPTKGWQGNDYWFGFGQDFHTYYPVKIAFIQCGLE
ncbi:hypothetical protein F5Y17DRAFT_430483 [Xylariaceae sp. FL0594]|nr:hypothetical protein F5Y17DRAFT_430483 [Xylariaceae sp. FL0594]